MTKPDDQTVGPDLSKFTALGGAQCEMWQNPPQNVTIAQNKNVAKVTRLQKMWQQRESRYFFGGSYQKKWGPLLLITYGSNVLFGTETFYFDFYP